MRRLAVLLVVVAAGAVLGPPPARAAPDSAAFVVIVDPENPSVSLDRTFVAEAFLKKTTRWPKGNVIKPADLPPDTQVRERFSHDVLRRSVGAVKSYWNQMIFSGRDVPPPELGSEEDIVRYVSSHRGAIGYVSPSAPLGNARVVTIR